MSTEKVSRERIAETLRKFHSSEADIAAMIESDAVDWDSLAVVVNAPPASDGSRHASDALIQSMGLLALSLRRPSV